MFRLRAGGIILMWMAGLLFLAGPACTDADIFETPGLGKGQRDNKMRVKGGFCTEHPDELKFPVKIMFIIDCSQSMIVTDPPPSPNEYPGRVRAVWEVIQKFRHDPGVEFAILRFEAAANVATQRDSNGDGIADMFGFVNDLASLLRALNSLVAAGGNTSYQAALGLAEATLAMDMSQSSVDERARTKYVVIFLSDGLPYPVDYDDEVNTPDSIRRALTEMMNLPKRFDVHDFTFHTAYLSVNTPDYVKQQAEGLLKSMANIGGGTYRNFENGEEINFLDIDYTSIKRMYSLKDGAFMVSNTNAHPAWTKTESIDTDGDGLVDILEEEIGTSIGMIDTDDDGFNDLLEYKLRRSGFDPLDPDDADCSLVLDRLDRDGDGLLDCEERFIGTSPDLFDTDADGIPDPVEFRFGTNPVWGDSDVDMDFDGSLNGNELAWHTNPTQNDAAQFSKLAYRYRLEKLPGVFESRLCYEFDVDNITLVGTPERTPGAPAGFNDIMVYAGQVPQDDPDDYGTFRVACARVRYIPRYPEPDIKYPPSGVVKFDQADFKRPVATLCGSDEECPHHVCDPYKHVCLAPFGDVCDELTPCPNFKCVKGFGAAASDPGVCESPVMVACLGPGDCPPYPIDPDTNTCMDPAHSPPDAVTGQCPKRECIPVYVACDAANPCQPDTDTNPDNDPECLNGFCRVPCFDAGDCNPGETCDPGGAADYLPCTINADCPTAGMECLNEGCHRYLRPGDRRGAAIPGVRQPPLRGSPRRLLLRSGVHRRRPVPHPALRRRAGPLPDTAVPGFPGMRAPALRAGPGLLRGDRVRRRRGVPRGPGLHLQRGHRRPLRPGHRLPLRLLQPGDPRVLLRGRALPGERRLLRPAQPLHQHRSQHRLGHLFGGRGRLRQRSGLPTQLLPQLLRLRERHRQGLRHLAGLPADLVRHGQPLREQRQ
jgi:hypothetical protein